MSTVTKTNQSLPRQTAQAACPWQATITATPSTLRKGYHSETLSLLLPDAEYA